MKSFSFIYICSAQVISPIFTLSSENQTGMEQYMNRVGKIKPELNDIWTVQQRAWFSNLPMFGHFWFGVYSFHQSGKTGRRQD